MFINMMGERSRELSILLLGDAICFITALWVTLLVRYMEVPSLERLDAHLAPFLSLTGVWLLFFVSAGLYDKQTMLIKQALRKRLWFVQVTNMVVASLLFLIIPFGIAPKINLIIYLVVSTLFLTLWRLRMVQAITPKRNKQKAILIADGPEAAALVDEVNNNDRYDYCFVRLVDEGVVTATADFEMKLIKTIEQDGVSIVVASRESSYAASIMPKLFELSFLKFEITFIDFVSLYEDTFDRVPFSALGYDWFISQVSQTRSVIYGAFKRVIDVVGAVGMIFLTAPLFPLAAIAIKLDDGGPLFYYTERVGQLGKIIAIYKFRTKNGSDSSEDALESRLVDTRVGSFMRKTRIDELPQLYNVLRGDLSFIGPRPEMPSLARVYAEKIPYYNARHLLKPGLSGWAQINDLDAPRGGVDIERTVSKLSYDLLYLKRRSIMVDIHIAVKTVATLLLRTGT